jgi:hypothetical protein
MRIETGTFELRDDMMIRELTYAETNEVAGGTGFASVSAIVQSGAGSTLVSSNTFFSLATSNTSASAFIAANFAASGANNRVSLSAHAEVF